MPRWPIVVVALISFCTCLTVSVNAEEHTSRPARKDEIVGFWQLVPLPAPLKAKALTTDPWPSPCQWYGYYNDGTLRTIDKFRGPCDEFTAKALAKTMESLPAVISWEYHEPALVIVKRSDVKNYAEAWEVTFVLKTFSKEGTEFRPGDIIMYLRNFKENKTLYIRHLRQLAAE